MKRRDPQPDGSRIPLPPPGWLALGWLDRDPQPRLICCEDLSLIWINPAGRAQLDRRRELLVRDGAIVVNHAHHGDFAAFVRRAGDKATTLSFPCENGDGHILFQARRIGEDGSRGFVGLVFHTTGSEFRAHYGELASAFQLTPAEQRVLDALLDGRIADQIAGDMSLSVETVRSHIRHIYGKLGVASREGLFHRLRPYRISLP